MRYELVITADSNDADYISETSVVTQEDIDKLLPIIELIKKKTKHYNWTTQDQVYGETDPKHMYPELSEDDIELFEEYLPYNEFGIHTIESIEYYPLPEKVKLL